VHSMSFLGARRLTIRIGLSLVRNLCSGLERSNNRRDRRGYASGRISEEICALDGAVRGAHGAVSEATGLADQQIE
jgi:hypothetical protein